MGKRGPELPLFKCVCREQSASDGGAVESPYCARMRIAYADMQRARAIRARLFDLCRSVERRAQPLRAGELVVSARGTAACTTCNILSVIQKYRINAGGAKFDALATPRLRDYQSPIAGKSDAWRSRRSRPLRDAQCAPRHRRGAQELRRKDESLSCAQLRNWAERNDAANE